MQSYCERVCPCQVTQECNQKTKSMQAELALLMIGKQFPYDEVVSQHHLQWTSPQLSHVNTVAFLHSTSPSISCPRT